MFGVVVPGGKYFFGKTIGDMTLTVFLDVPSFANKEVISFQPVPVTHVSHRCSKTRDVK